MNYKNLDKDDIAMVKLFYEDIQKPNITTDDCWQDVEENVSANAMIDGLNLVDGDTYVHFLPLDTVKKLEAKDPNYVKQTGLFDYRQAYNACKVGLSFPKALPVSEIRKHARKAVKELSKISVKN